MLGTTAGPFCTWSGACFAGLLGVEGVSFPGPPGRVLVFGLLGDLVEDGLLGLLVACLDGLGEFVVVCCHGVPPG